MNVYENIKNACVSKNISVAELERATKLSENSLWLWNKKMPNLTSLLKVADYFELPLDYFVGRTVTPRQENNSNNINMNGTTHDNIVSSGNNNNFCKIPNENEIETGVFGDTKKVEHMNDVCPYCGESKDYYKFQQYTNKPKSNYIAVKQCVHCMGLSLFEYSASGKITLEYPIKAKITIPKEVENFSPRAVLTYSHTIQAKSENLYSIVGCSIRASFEILITDYLINIQKENKENILNINLYERIKKLDSSLNLNAASNLLRLYGNDKTHYDDRYNAETEEMISYYDLICAIMSNKIKALDTEKELAKLNNIQKQQPPINKP